MRDLIWKNKHHIFLWAGMLAYLFLAPRVHMRYFLQEAEGRPASFRAALPEPSTKVKAKFTGMDDLDNGLYNLRGWATYQQDLETSRFNRFIVLQSETRTYFFAVPKDEPEFFIQISKEFLEPGTYHLGILFLRKSDKSLYYRQDAATIVRTPNQLQLNKNR
jgi:hypothetical protein